jgi:hypothetical protein
MIKTLVEPVTLRDEPIVFGLELFMRCLKLFVLGLELVILDQKLLVLGVLSEAFSLAVALVEARRPCLLRNGGIRFRLRLSRGRYGERVVALFAADLAADVNAPDAQRGLTARAAHGDMIDLLRWRNYSTSHVRAGTRGEWFVRLPGEE